MMRALLTAAACAAAVIGIAAPASADPVSDSQSAYLDSVHEYTRSNPQAFPDATAMTDQQLLEAGNQACHVRDTGGHFHRYGISPFIYSRATNYLCPQ